MKKILVITGSAVAINTCANIASVGTRQTMIGFMYHARELNSRPAGLVSFGMILAIVPFPLLRRDIKDVRRK